VIGRSDKKRAPAVFDNLRSKRRKVIELMRRYQRGPAGGFVVYFEHPLGSHKVLLKLEHEKADRKVEAYCGHESYADSDGGVSSGVGPSS
jgi:hypothetical protein